MLDLLIVIIVGLEIKKHPRWSYWFDINDEKWDIKKAPAVQSECKKGTKENIQHHYNNSRGNGQC